MTSSMSKSGRVDPATASYMNTAMAARLLTRDHEQELARAWRDQRDEKALHTLVNAHGKLVVAAAQKFRHYGLPVADLIQEGHIGLLEAANRFDPDRDIRFATYALWWVRATMQDYILRNYSMVRLGSTAAQKSLFFNLRKLRARIEGQAQEELGASAKHAAIAKKLDVTVNDVAEMEQRLSGGDASLNRPWTKDSDEEWIGLLRDERPNPEDIVMGMKDARTRSAWLNDALSGLPERERQIIKYRHLSDRVKTLEELGITLGVSKERVRQLEIRALEKLRDTLADHQDDLYHQGGGVSFAA